MVDTQDRYDCDGDGNFDEADGYVDHFQLVHAGEGEEAGGGAQGGDAIWSHRWYAGQGGVGTKGPKDCLLGGYRVPGTKLWVGDYTTEPENGASGVFTHEYGHDLGLPDHYDTAGANDNSADFWTLMASSWPSDSADAIGDNPYHMGAWDKLVLGWSDFATVDPGQEKNVNIGPAEGCLDVRMAGASRQPAELHPGRHGLPGGRRRSELLLLGSGQRHRDHDASFPGERVGFGHRADVPDPVRHRRRLGLRLRRVLR